MRPSCLVNVKDDDVVKKKKMGRSSFLYLWLAVQIKNQMFWKFDLLLTVHWFFSANRKRKTFFFFSFLLLFTLILLLLLCYQTNIRYPRQADSLDTLTLPISYRVFLLGTPSFLLLGYCLFPFYLLTNVNRFRGALRTSLVFFFSPDLPK